MEFKSKFILITAMISLLFLSEEMQGQKRGPQDRRVNPKTYRHDGNRYRVQPIPRKPRVRYPRYSRVVPRLPYGYRRLNYGGLHFYFHAGIFYSSCDDGYVVVLPPAGFRIAVLPVGYTRIMVGPSVYFYYGGVYYIEKQEEDVEEKYEVADAPVGAVVEKTS